MPLPSTLVFAASDVAYIAELNQLVADVNLAYAAFLATQSGALFSATSASSHTATTGSKTFTLAEASQRAFSVGSPVRITDSVTPANYMDGSITAYAHPSVTVNVTSVSSAFGTKTAWAMGLTAGFAVVPVASGGTGATTVGGAQTALGIGSAGLVASSTFATAAQGTTADNALPKAGGTMSGAVAHGNNNITGVKVLAFNGEVANTPAAGVVTIDFATGNNQKVTLNAATITATLSNLPLGHSQLRVVQDATGSRALVLTGGSYSSSRWLGSVSQPALNTSANGESVINFFWDGTSLMQSLCRVGMV